eukprot:TRINITY_DN295_c1_g2_i4.p1 TRINITY_DN295_c1_g2~~TRINITY_DN295_c1_g2_i4.p1  ORF type:complete len:419 (+),score=47.34 TRINITY_DN295_c1_g2_i4:187-1257(+)
MPPTSAPVEGMLPFIVGTGDGQNTGFSFGYNPNAKEFYPVTMVSPQSSYDSIDVGFDRKLQGQHVHISLPTAPQSPVNYPETIKEVWNYNLDEVVNDMSDLVKAGYNVIGMDTEFPGVVAHANAKNVKNGSSPLWQTIRVNVNILKVIQIGMCFRDAKGNPPPDKVSTFQINFAFDLDNDMYALDSIKLLTDSGIEFSQLKEKGCDVSRFAELILSSGLVLSDEITWVSFASGYDFAYLIRLLTSQEVPYEESQFLELLEMYFPSFYDTKHMARTCEVLQWNGGLDGLASVLGAARIGQAHQAGSDSLVTVNVFFKLLFNSFSNSGSPSPESVKNVLSGLGSGAITPHRGVDDRFD